ncbi:MAG: AMP-binding protein, partial [bacterium]
DTALSVLPLSHAFERLAGNFVPLTSGATIAYAESTKTVAKNLLEVQPTMMVCVPRLYEKVQGRVLENVEKSSALRRKIFFWALNIGKKVLYHPQNGNGDPWLKFKYRLAEKLVYNKIRKRTGGRIRFFVSGGAALPPSTAEFFLSVGLTIIEGYGLTECSPVLTANRLDDNRIGTVGKPIAGVQIKIAPDGEILAKGDNIMQGYYNLPEDTKEVMLEDGFMATGDIGHFDEKGSLVITDRKKNIIVTSGGRNIAPTPIENLLKQSKYISEVMLIGEGRHFLSALIVPDFEQLRVYAKQNNIPCDDDHALVRDSKVYFLIESEIANFSKDLSDYEQIRKFTLLPREFSIVQNELTPTLKIRRNVVTEKFLETIESMYE